VILTKGMGNEILEALKSAGLDPATCTLADPMPETSFRLANPFTADRPPGRARVTHRPTGSTFTISRAEEREFQYLARMKVGQADFGSVSSRPWSQLLSGMQDWASYVRDEEADTPDLWAEVQEVPEVLAAAQASDASNAPFTADEQVAIRSKLDEARQLIREQREQLGLTSEQIEAFDQRLDFVEEASTRLGRKDWLMMAMGAILSSEMPPHVIQAIVTTVIHGVAHIFGIGGLPPMITA